MEWWLKAIEGLVTGALGGLATVYGLSKWLGNLWLEKQKAKYSKELEEFKAKFSKELEEFKDKLLQQQKRIQAEIDRSVLVTRAHFETEFDSMKTIFKALSQTRLYLNGVRPTNDDSPNGETVEDKNKRFNSRLALLQDAYNSLLELSEATSAFYPIELYEAVGGCLKAARWEIQSIRVNMGYEPFSNKWYQQGSENRAEFGKAYDQAVTVIRDRISRLAVLPASQ
jgi:hypothetical protein